jgi:hypothetical protein
MDNSEVPLLDNSIPAQTQPAPGRSWVKRQLAGTDVYAWTICLRSAWASPPVIASRRN